jgi:hypothetical protein
VSYRKAQDILLRDLPYWWLTEQGNVAAYSAKVHGLQYWSASSAERAWISGT